MYSYSKLIQISGSFGMQTYALIPNYYFQNPVSRKCGSIRRFVFMCDFLSLRVYIHILNGV